MRSTVERPPYTRPTIGSKVGLVHDRLRQQRAPVSAKQIVAETGLSIVNVCVALKYLTDRGLAERAGARCHYTYTAKG